jgi:histone deacetylase 1/2
MLDKALYGCIESGKLWNQRLSKFLSDLGFIANPHDICVFNKDDGNNQITVCVYVDDLLITCVDKSKIDGLMDQIKEEFKELKINSGNNHSYLGMSLDFSKNGQTKVTMEGFISDLLKSCELDDGISVSTPALPNLFDIDEKSIKLDSNKSIEFHSRVAKLLYLAKRVRPDILCATTFLSTRVQFSTEQDWQKLDRILRYLNGTKELGIVLNIGKEISVRAFVDASFGVHADFKGHTGGNIVIGESGSIFVKSVKQKLMTKSSTESELVAASELLPQTIHIREFLICQGYKMNEAIIYQDNKSTIALIKKGRSTAESTRHISIRFYFIKDRVENKEIRIEYLQTEDMLADIFTKPLQGERFRVLRDKLLNWN